MAWIFGFVVLKTVIEHLPYEFGQPYIALTLGESVDKLINAPWISGVIFAIVALIGGIAAMYTVPLRNRFGVVNVLLGLTLLQTFLVVAMSLIYHPIVVFLLIFRSVQGAIANVIVAAEVAPRIPQQQRATYLSLQSLVGRLAFSLTLLGLSLIPGSLETFSTQGLNPVMTGAAAVAVLGFLALVATSRIARKDQALNQD
jgi:hypothetical protein